MNCDADISELWSWNGPAEFISPRGMVAGPLNLSSPTDLSFGHGLPPGRDYDMRVASLSWRASVERDSPEPLAPSEGEPLLPPECYGLLHLDHGCHSQNAGVG